MNGCESVKRYEVYGDKYELRYEFLKMSEKYEKCCASDGAGPLALLYAHFGDIRGVSYETWCARKRLTPEERGADYFCEEVTTEEDAIFSLGEGTLIVKCNVYSTKTQIKKRFAELVDAHVSKKSGNPSEDIFSEFPINRRVNVASLSKALAVLRYWEANKKTATLFQIGDHLGISQAILKNREGVTGRKDKMASAVARLRTQAMNIVKAVEAGYFPTIPGKDRRS